MIAFVHVAKTAGSSVGAMLRSAFGRRYCASVPLRRESAADMAAGPVLIDKYSPDDVRTLLRLAPGTRCIGGHHVALWSDVEAVVPDVTYFLFLRDPIKRAASHFQYIEQRQDMTPYFGKKHLTWEEWCGWEAHHDHQVKMLSATVDPDDAIRLLESKRAFVGLTDRFDESLVLFRGLFAPRLNIAYSRRNTALGNDTARKILADARKVSQIREMYAREFPVYDYVVNELYPRYVREYGATLAADLERYRISEQARVNRLNTLAARIYRKYVFKPRYRRYLSR